MARETGLHTEIYELQRCEAIRETVKRHLNGASNVPLPGGPRT